MQCGAPPAAAACGVMWCRERGRRGFDFDFIFDFYLFLFFAISFPLRSRKRVPSDGRPAGKIGKIIKNNKKGRSLPGAHPGHSADGAPSERRSRQFRAPSPFPPARTEREKRAPSPRIRRRFFFSPAISRRRNNYCNYARDRPRDAAAGRTGRARARLRARKRTVFGVRCRVLNHFACIFDVDSHPFISLRVPRLAPEP